MKRITIVLLAFLMVFSLVFSAGCQTKEKAKPKGKKETKVETPKPANPDIILATTTSTQDTGLLDVLIPLFGEATGYKVKVIAVGTGEALAMGARGEADVLLVHSRQAEDEFMAAGNGSVRKDVMHNDFVIVGPKTDPAGIKETTTTVETFKKIAAAKVIFITRADDSGTYKKEQKIWEKADIKPEGKWFVQTGQGMGESLRIANNKLGYILSDRGTYLSAKESLELVILVEKDAMLLNPYGVIVVNPDKFPKVNAEGAKAFADWMTSAKIQKVIGEFGKKKYGQALFVPDAIKNSKQGAGRREQKAESRGRVCND